MNVSSRIIPAGLPVVLLVMGVILATGCVSQRVVDNLDTLYRRSQEQIIDLRAELDERKAEIELMRSTISNRDPLLMAKLQNALDRHDQLSKALAQAESRLRSIDTGPILDPDLDAALLRLAESNPQLMTYEPRVGMVKFQSDLTFGLGSTEISSEAKNSLVELAAILKSPLGIGYNSRIVGHTDNVPIGKPSTRSQHPTNWHLSVHRAISVKDALAQAGVDQSRMEVAGYGEHRPIAANGSKGNVANRRVEIYLLRQRADDAELEPAVDHHSRDVDDTAEVQLMNNSEPSTAPPATPDVDAFK